MSPDYESLFSSFLQQAAEAAGTIARGYFRQNIPVDNKQDRSPVTQADREIEARLREMIAKTFPGHGMIGEEYGCENEGVEFVWCLDPIDGTKSFITGRPLFGTIVGLLHNGQPVAGLIDQPFTRERWIGIAGRPSTHNGVPIHVAPPRKLDDGRLYTGSLDMFEGDPFAAYLRLCRTARLAQYSCDCYAYGLLAMGWCDVVVERGLKVYDIAGVIPIIVGAGGVVLDWQGRLFSMAHFTGELVAASSWELALEVVAICATGGYRRLDRMDIRLSIIEQTLGNLYALSGSDRETLAALVRRIERIERRLELQEDMHD